MGVMTAATKPSIARAVDFPFHVQTKQDITIPLRDGCKLAASLWLPTAKNPKESNPSSSSYAVVLEYLPYQKVYWTYERDQLHLPYFAGHGYAVVRVDMRGSGNSEGLYEDEYAVQEQEDCLEVIEWIAAQEWCNEKIVMYGKSWGGFNGLQVAALNPEHLAGVISAYSTDDRYADDIHYMGGCLLAIQALSWSSQMFMWNARPPHPGTGNGGICMAKKDESPLRSGNNEWLKCWKMRLESLQPWIETWLEEDNQLRGDYWKHGSICEDYDAIECPVLLIGGFYDGYTDPVFRMLKNMKSIDVMGVVGPWGHNWPEAACPGPQIGSMQLFNSWMNTFVHDNSSMCDNLRNLQEENWDRVAVYRFGNDFELKMDSEFVPGYWKFYDKIVGKVSLRESDDGEGSLLKLVLKGDNTMRCFSEGENEKELGPVKDGSLLSYTTDLRVGRNSGDWIGWGGVGGELPDEQCQDDACSLIFDFKSDCRVTSCESAQTLRIAGCPIVDVDIASSTSPHNQIFCRLCKVNKVTGKSFLLTRGCLNLCHNEDHSKGVLPTRDSSGLYRIGRVKVLLQACYADVDLNTYDLRLALSSSYWPFLWPSRELVTWKVRPENSFVHIPTDESEISSDVTPRFESPMICEAPGNPRKEGLVEASRVFTDILLKTRGTGGKKLRHLLRYEFKDATGASLFDDGTLVGESSENIFEIVEGDPLSAKAYSNFSCLLSFPGVDSKIQIDTKSCLSCDEDNFHIDNSVNIEYLKTKESFFSKTFSKCVKRNFI
eukprot:Nk52_evm5s545 gene=Nk52_evmTU5s545